MRMLAPQVARLLVVDSTPMDAVAMLPGPPEYPRRVRNGYTCRRSGNDQLDNRVRPETRRFLSDELTFVSEFVDDILTQTCAAIVPSCLRESASAVARFIQKIRDTEG